jgi:hypothetical protein
MSSVRPITLDDATAVEHLLADAVDNYRGRRVELPTAMRDLDIRRPIRVPPHVWGLRLAGQGQHFTTFHLNFNDSDLPPERRVLFELVNARDFVAEHFGVRAERYAAAVAVHRSLRVRENNSLMNHPVWRHVAVQGGARLIEDGFVHTAVQAEGAAPNDVNDEHAAYEHVTVDNLAGSAFVFGHAQAKAMSVTDCEWSACGRYGIDATGRGRWGAGADQGGTFTATRCKGGYSDVAEFGVGRPAGPVRVLGGDFEGVVALLRQPNPYAGPSMNAQPITIEVDRCAAARLRPDGGLVAVFNGGPLRVLGGEIGEGAPRPPLIYHGGLAGISTIVEGVSFVAEGADHVFPVIQERIGRYAIGDWHGGPRTLRVRHNLYRGGPMGCWVVPEFERDETQDAPR